MALESLISSFDRMPGSSIGHAPSSVDGGAAPDDVTVSLGRCLVRLHDDLDLVTAPAVLEELTALLDGSCCDITLDLRDVAFCDVAGLRVLLRTSALLADRGGQIFVIAACPSLRMMLAAMFDADPPHLQLIDAAA